MEKLFKKLTVLDGFVYAEKNRNISLSDYVEVKKQTLDIKDTHITKTGKTISISSSYEMINDVIMELCDYGIKCCVRGSGNKDICTEMINKTYLEFNITKTTDIDFRGCKTEFQRTVKVEKAKKELMDEYNEKIALWLSSKIISLNESLDTRINLNNNEFQKRMISVLVNESVYSEDLQQDQEYTELDSSYKDIINRINELTEVRAKIEDKLTLKKRSIAINSLEKQQWSIGFEEDNHEDVLPQPVIDSIKNSISSSFTYNIVKIA